MGKEGENNRWTEIEKIIDKDKEEKPERKYEINEELLTGEPEEIVASLEIREDALPIVTGQIRRFQENYQEQIKSGNKELELNIKEIWTKAIQGIIDTALSLKK